MLLAAPSCPAGCGELWRIFGELHACRGNSGFGPMCVTFTEIDAYQRVSGVKLQAWELDAIRRADAAFLADWSKRNKRDD